MGFTENRPELQASLEFEAAQYQDIVQEDFLDTYHNLTYKGVAGLKYLKQHCYKAKFVLKTDDDIFVNMFTLLKHLDAIQDTHSTGLLMCLRWVGMPVLRSGKWKVERSDYNGTEYPNYCSGCAYTMSMDVAIALHDASYYVPFFWVDDVYITGLLPRALGLTHKRFGGVYDWSGEFREVFTGPRGLAKIFAHVHSMSAIQAVWDKVMKSRGRVTVPYALPGHLPNETQILKEREEKRKQRNQQ